MTKIQNSKLVLVIQYWNLRFVCDLVLGLWDFIDSNTPTLQLEEKPSAVHPTSGSAFSRSICVVALIRDVHDTNCDTYRCFLPDLTGFVSVCCAVSNQQQSQTTPG